MKNKSFWILTAVLLFGGMGVFYNCILPQTEKTEILEEAPLESAPQEVEDVLSEKKTVDNTEIYVHVCGQVKNPGVYTLSEGSRVAEAVELAGGLTKKADETSINLARKVQDGEQLYVFEEGEKVLKEALVPDSPGMSININSAGKEELLKLPGIGEAKADAIISYRMEHGGFEKIEDLKKIEGIKDGVFEKIKDKIVI